MQPESLTDYLNRNAKCADCGHRQHQPAGVSGGGCNEIIDNGWNWHGCHCTAKPVWLRRMNEDKLPAKDMTPKGRDAA